MEMDIGLINEDIRVLNRHLNSIEHMIYVSCKFTRTTEMLKKVMETIVNGYEQFFGVAYRIFIDDETIEANNVLDRIKILKEGFLMNGLDLDLSDYFLLKRLLMSDFECIGEYRKNLCMVSYLDGSEYIINISKLLNFYENLKNVCVGLGSFKNNF